MAMQEMADYDAIPDWALSGMSICFYNGILSGKPGNLLDPTALPCAPSWPPFL